MIKNININCDIGEGAANENKLMPFIQYCNIACGGHAGDEISMTNMVKLAIANQVKIGAHPSYPDKENFGRKSLLINSDKLIDSIQSQINKLIKITENYGSSITHIKPHGALYNDIAKNVSLAKIFMKAISIYKLNTILFVPFNSAIEKIAIENGFTVFYEAFADRNYNDDLSLVNRSKNNALITSNQLIINHVKEIVETGMVKTINNIKVKIKADTFCVHSDTKNALSIVKNLNNHFNLSI